MNHDPRFASRNDADCLNLECGSGLWQRHLIWGLRKQPQQVIETVPALPARNEVLPMHNYQIDRRQGSPAYDRAGDDDATRRLLIDNEIGADAEHSGLQHHARCF